jgi:hypothetical protein
LGHLIDAQGLHPTQEKIKAVSEAPRPQNVSQLRSFIGLLTYYSKFLHFDRSRPLILACDASAYGLGAVLSHQMPNGDERPIAYVSRTLNAAEKRYSQLEKEGFAILFGVGKSVITFMGSILRKSQTTSCPHSTTGIPPAEMLMGRRLRSRLDLLYPDVSKRVESQQE